MSRLCDARGCATWGYHAAGCAGEPECGGCRPREAVAGLRLCPRDVDGLRAAVRKAAENHEALLLVLGGRATWLREMVGGTRDRGLVLNLGAAGARFEIEGTLARWCRLVAARRKLTGPSQATDCAVAAEFLLAHVDWLAGEREAGQAYEEMRELASGWPWRAAYPSGPGAAALGRCPEADCAGLISGSMTPDGASLDFIQCDGDTLHRWSREELFRLWPRLVELANPPALTTAEAALVLGVSQASVRQLAMRGRLMRDGGGFSAASVIQLRGELWPEGENDASVAVRLHYKGSETAHTGRARVPAYASSA